MKRKLISVSLALALGLSLAACGSKPAPSGAETPAGELGTLSGPVELQFWHSISNQNHLKVLEGLVEEFNETIGAEKGITVVPTFNGSSSELYSSVVGAIKAGSAPDVTLALRPYVADYLQTDYVVNLEPYITDPNVGMTDYEDIFEGLREANSSYAKEGIYSLPIHSYSEVLYYNKTFFAEHGLSVPTTWDELVETCRAIRDITGAPAFGWDNLAGSFMTLLLQNGGRYTDQNGNLYFATEDSDITLKVLQMWQDNVNEGIWRTAGEDQFFSGPFANEMIHMYIGDSVEASYIPDKNPELDWGTAPVPQVSEDTAANLSAGHVIIALNQDGNQDRMYAAYEFIKFMTSHDANLAVAAGNTGYLPIRQSVAEDPAYEAYVADGHEYMRAGVEQSDRYFYEPVFTNATTTSSAVNSAVKTMMQEVADNGMEPEQALANLKQTVSRPGRAERKPDMIPIFYHDIVTPSGHPGDEVISALQKFIRRGETELAVRAAYELYLTGEELTAYLWRRLLVISAEDVGLGEPMAPVVVDALHRSSRELSRDSSDYQLLFVHAVRYLCACRKERGSSVLASVVKRRIRRGDPFPLPDYVYDMHTLTGQERGRNIDHFLAEAACVRPGVRATAEELEETERWERELVALMKEEEAQQDRT